MSNFYWSNNQPSLVPRCMLQLPDCWPVVFKFSTGVGVRMRHSICACGEHWNILESAKDRTISNKKNLVCFNLRSNQGEGWNHSYSSSTWWTLDTRPEEKFRWVPSIDDGIKWCGLRQSLSSVRVGLAHKARPWNWWNLNMKAVTKSAD